jgi:hypothetical protein
MAGIPNKSAHFGGAIDTTNTALNFYPPAILENIYNAGALAITFLSDLENQVGGPVYKNSTTNYTSRFAYFEKSQFDYMGGGNSNVRDATVGGILNAIDTYTTKVSGLCNIALTDGRLGDDYIYGKVTKPTVAVIADADPITPIGGVRKFVNNYNSNAYIGLATSNRLQVLVSPAPSSPYAVSDLTTPAVLGTSHANFTSNNYILGTSMMLYGAKNNALLTGTKLSNGITYTDNMLNGSSNNLIQTYPLMYYDIENP